jgi:2-oxoglutarate dehydrogenase E2 component (dihydrolipoamide succinyltransferase)
MTVESIDGYADELRDELLELLRATARHHDPHGPRPHVWEHIQAAIAPRHRAVPAAPTGPAAARPVIPIGSARRVRARRPIGRVAAIAAAVATLGGLAYAGLAPGVDDTPAPVSESAPDATPDPLAEAARRATQEAGAQVVHLTTGDGASALDVVVLPDGTAYVLESQLRGAARYMLYAVVDETRVLLGTLRGAGAVALDRIPQGAVLVALVDEAGTLVAGAPLFTAPAPFPLPEEPPAGVSLAPRSSPVGPGAEPAPAAPAPVPAPDEGPLAPPPEPSSGPGIGIELPPLLRIEVPLFG